MQMSIPMILEGGTFSFKNILARITDMMGEDVVPINAILIASEKCPAIYTKVLNRLTPVTAANKK